jgi:hypothetical protein
LPVRTSDSSPAVMVNFSGSISAGPAGDTQRKL